MLAAAGCSGSSLDDDKDSSGPIKVGTLWPTTGVYEKLGTDGANGWNLYLSTHGNKLGGHKVEVTTADEGDGKAATLNGTKKLLDKDKVDVVVGTESADAVLSAYPLTNKAKVPFVGTGGRPSTLKDVSYTWHTSWLSTETGAAIAKNVKDAVKGPVYVIGPNYQGGKDQLGGFTKAFTAAGGTIANGGEVKWTPWPAVGVSYLPYFNAIASSGAKAIYTFYAGAAAIQFVKDYKASGLKGKIPLYGAGFLTEGAVLPAEGDAADGIKTALNYASNLDNAQNRVFAPAYQKKYNSSATVYAVAGYDAAAILDRAISAAGDNADSESINEQLGKLGAIDSPRGQWRFGKGHTPIQPFYLREVKNDGKTRANVVVANLATLGS
jgi:branched-chain amino acid transport system substrate-binding protein